MFSTLARGYNSLQQSAQPQSAASTIDKLCDRLLHHDAPDERRAALLGLKGLSRDWKAEVGTRALPILLGVLEDDCARDVETAKAVVETLALVCELDDSVRDDSGLRNTDAFLATPSPLHTLLTLLTPTHFYLRFFALQLLGILLNNRSKEVQSYVLTSPGGIGRLVETLDDSREIIRNESLLLIISLTTANAEIQKLLAFEGAFDKLFSIVRNEGGIGSGGIVVQDCLAAIAGLLRWNVSNQNYFRETSCIPLLAPLLLFPRPNALSPASLATFAFQSWSEQKTINAGLVISLVRMLVGGAGSGKTSNQKALLASGVSRCLIELGLASNAPVVVKSQALHALADILKLSPPNQELLTSLIVTPLIPPRTAFSHALDGGAFPSDDYEHGGAGEAYDSPRYGHDDPLASSQHSHYGRGEGGSGGEYDDATGDYPRPSPRSASTKWRKGAAVPAVVAVVSIAVNGDGASVEREALRIRAAAASVFENYVAGSTETQLGILSTMSAPQPDELPGPDGVVGGPGGPGGRTQSAGSILLHALRAFPAPGRNEQFDPSPSFFASLLFSHLLLHSETSKAFARRIYFAGSDTEPGGEGDEDDRTSLVAVLVGNFMMAQREQATSQNQGLGPERMVEWSRVMVGYLTALATWLWESPGTVKEFLSEGSNLQVLIQPITQASGVDSLVQGLCTFVLGICYEYNREPGPITRETLHPILQSRVGPDQFVSRILRLREDPRFRTVGPNVLEVSDDDDGDDARLDNNGGGGGAAEARGLWFDFTFVEFLKTNYIAVQRAILVEPHATSSMRTSIDASSTSDLVTALRASLSDQARELEEMRELVHQLESDRDQERIAFQAEVASLSDTISRLAAQVAAARTDKDEADREQEDLLVLLEDLSVKRKHDKRRMRIALMDVSSDDDDDDEDDNDKDNDDELNLQGQDDHDVEPERERSDERGRERVVGHVEERDERDDDDDDGRAPAGQDHVATYHYEPSEHGRGGGGGGGQEYVYGDESAVFRGGEYDAQPYDVEGPSTSEGPTGWSPNGYEYQNHHP